MAAATATGHSPAANGGGTSNGAGTSSGAGKPGGGSLQAAMDEGMEPPTPTARAELDAEAAERLVQRFPEFFALYSY